MKLLLTIWISAVLTQEVFSSTLVRYRRHSVGKPTSSVHTEYEATYEQKGKHGNGSYSTVSGKQEVVHDNCNDNWNAFADKCATLIKDLVASLGNAVSSKPGDATNLQLRIRNTFKHFDSTDNCTCFAKNSLTSLFDNITATTVQPSASSGSEANHRSNNGEVISSAQTQSTACEGESCNDDSDTRQRALTADPKSVQQRPGQPNLSLTNAKNVDPELADTSKEVSTSNSRRGVQYPETIVKDPSQSSGNAGAAIGDSKQPSPASRSSSETKKILFPVSGTPQPVPAPAKATGSPAEVVSPLSRSQSSVKSAAPSQTSAPQQDSLQVASAVDRPAKSNDIIKSGTSVKPVPALSSASKISSPEATGSPSALNNAKGNGGAAGSKSGSSQVPDVKSEAITPVQASVKPVDGVVPVNREAFPAANNAPSNQTPVAAPVIMTEPVNSAVAEPEVASAKSEGKKDDFDKGKGSESERPPAAPPVVATAKPVSDAMAEPEIISSKGSSEPVQTPITAPVVSVSEPVSGAVAEPQITSGKSEGDKDNYEKEKGSESDRTPVVTPVASTAVAEPSGNSEGSPASNQTPVILTEPVNSAVPEPEIVSSKGSPVVNNAASSQTSSIVSEPLKGAVADPEITSSKSEGDKDDCDKEKGSESDRTPVTAPVVLTEPVNSAAVEPEVGSSKGSSEPVQTSTNSMPETVSGVAAEPEITSGMSEGSKGDNNKEKSSESGSVPVAPPVTATAEPVNDAMAEPEISSSKGSSEPVQTPTTAPVVSVSEPVSGAVAEPQITSGKSEGDKIDLDEEKGSESERTPVSPSVIATSEPVNDAVAAPQITSTAAEGDNDEEGAAGNGSASNQRAVVEPVTSSFQDPSAVVSDGSTNSAPNPKSSVPATPVSNSGDSEMPEMTQAADSTQAPLSMTTLDDPAPPETASTSDNVNVIPALTVKQPQSQPLAHENPSTAVPKINSDSNLPDSTGPVDNVETVNPSPIYQSLPTAPSATPSSDGALINNKPQQPTTKQEVMSGVPSTTERDKASQSGGGRSTSAVKEIPAAPAAVDDRSQDPTEAAQPLTAGKDGKKPPEKVFIVTPVPVYPDKKEPVVIESGDQSTDSVAQSSKNADSPEGSEKTGVPNTKPSEGAIASEPQVPSDAMAMTEENEKTQPQVAPQLVTTAPVYTASVKPISGMSQPEGQSLRAGGGAPGRAVLTPQMGDNRQEIPLTTPTPVILVDAKEQNGGAAEGSAPGRPSLQQHPLFSNLGNKKSGGSQPKETTGEPAAAGVQTAEDSDLTKPTTFQTTSTDPTPPQSPPSKDSVSLTRPPSVPQDSDETAPRVPATSPQTPPDDDDEEDCCSCESCTEEEVTNPKQYKEMACKDLEEARKELKAIFDKIKKRLKCGKKAPQKIVAS